MKFISHIREFLEAKDRAIISALEEIGLFAEMFVKQEISEPKPHADGSKHPSVISGELRRSIDHEKDIATETAFVGTNLEYAPYVELGTSRTRAYPYLRPGVTKHIDDYKQIARKHLTGG